MSLKLKTGVNPEELRKYGFKLGREWAEQGERCLEGIGYEYQHEWYHKFLMDEEDPDNILYADEDYDQPVASIAVRIGNNYKNDLYIECIPSGTYHVSGSELDVVTDTLFDLAQAGLLEKCN